MKAASPRVAATNLSPTTRRRCSAPGAKVSTSTPEPSVAASSKARVICSLVRSPVKTPRPWLASRGFTTTGKPRLSAALQASSASSTGRPSGTGTPAERRSCLVSCLSWAMKPAIALVRSVSAVQMRRAFLPWPSCTKLRSLRRRAGMLRASAALTIAMLLGPRQ